MKTLFILQIKATCTQKYRYRIGYSRNVHSSFYEDQFLRKQLTFYNLYRSFSKKVLCNSKYSFIFTEGPSGQYATWSVRRKTPAQNILWGTLQSIPLYCTYLIGFSIPRFMGRVTLTSQIPRLCLLRPRKYFLALNFAK